MAHSNTVLAQRLNVIPRHQFQKTVDHYQADKRTRTLSCWGQFVALLVGQLSSASSLRGLVEQLDVQSRRLYHLGLKPVRKSTLADANQKHSTLRWSITCCSFACCPVWPDRKVFGKLSLRCN